MSIESKVKALENHFDRNIGDMIRKPNNYKKEIYEKYENQNTRALLINLPMVLIKRNDPRTMGLSAKNIEVLKRNSDAELAKRNKANDAKQETMEYIPFDQIREKAMVQAKSPEEKLIAALYTTMPPVRDDYGGMKVVKRLKEVPTTGNWYVKAIKKFVFQDYKTERTYGRVIAPASPEAHKAILKYMRGREAFPSGPLGPLVKQVTGETIHNVRHSYISTFMKNNPTPTEKDTTARRMLHSKETQAKYELWTKKNDPDMLD